MDARRGEDAAAVRRDAGPRARRGDEVRRRAGRDHACTTWARGPISTSSRARARRAGCATRIYAAVPLDTWQRLRDDGEGEAPSGPTAAATSGCASAALKGFVDGSLGSHTAAFQEPFTDAPKDRGFFVNTPEDLYTWICGADKAGLQVMVHAIGDRANRTLLDIYERVTNEHGPRDRRFRIEHAQHLAAADIPRFAQARRHRQHAAVPRDRRRPMGRAGDRAGARQDAHMRFARCSTPARRWRSAATGSSRRRRRSRASTRRSRGGRSTTSIRTAGCPSRRSPSRRRWSAYTMGGAYASFEEKEKGDIAPGMLADLVLIDKDLRAIPAPRDQRRQGDADDCAAEKRCSCAEEVPTLPKPCPS